MRLDCSLHLRILGVGSIDTHQMLADSALQMNKYINIPIVFIVDNLKITILACPFFKKNSFHPSVSLKDHLKHSCPEWKQNC